MATIARVPVVWDGLPGFPGVSVFYWDFTVAPDLSELNAFFTAIRNEFHASLTWTIPAAGDTIDDSSGVINGDWIATGSGTITGGGGSTPYAAGAGARAVWTTTGLVGGRRVRGSTYLVPLVSSSYDASGTIATTPLGVLRNAAIDLAANGGMKVWSRNDPGSTNGASFPVTSGTVPDKVSTLRSRRI